MDTDPMSARLLELTEAQQVPRVGDQIPDSRQARHETGSSQGIRQQRLHPAIATRHLEGDGFSWIRDARGLTGGCGPSRNGGKAPRSFFLTMRSGSPDRQHVRGGRTFLRPGPLTHDGWETDETAHRRQKGRRRRSTEAHPGPALGGSHRHLHM